MSVKAKVAWVTGILLGFASAMVLDDALVTTVFTSVAWAGWMYALFALVEWAIGRAGFDLSKLRKEPT
jgi:hypothetical protein